MNKYNEVKDILKNIEDAPEELSIFKDAARRIINVEREVQYGSGSHHNKLKNIKEIINNTTMSVVPDED